MKISLLNTPYKFKDASRGPPTLGVCNMEDVNS